jgi:hypothetical protein
MNQFLFLKISVYSTAEIIDADYLRSPQETSILSTKITGSGIHASPFLSLRDEGEAIQSCKIALSLTFLAMAHRDASSTDA